MENPRRRAHRAGPGVRVPARRHHGHRPAGAPAGAAAPGCAGRPAAQRSRVLRDPRSQRPRLHQRIQRHVLRREDRRHRDHPERCPAGDRRGRPPVAHAGAVGPDSQSRRAEGGQGHQHHHVPAAVRGLRFRLEAGGDTRGHGLPCCRPRRQAGAREARGPGGPEPRVPAVPVLRAHVPGRRQARDLPALSDGADTHQAGRHEDPAVRGLLDLRRPGPERVRGGPAGGDGADVGPGAGGRRTPRHHQSGLRRPPVARRAQSRPERLVHRPVAAAAEGDGEGGGVGRQPERHPELDAEAGRRLLAGRLPPGAEEGGRDRTGPERHGARDRVPLRGDAGRRTGGTDEGHGPGVGLVPAVQVRHGRLQHGEPPRALLHPVRDAEDGDVPDWPERVRHDLASRPPTCGSRSRWTT